LITKQKAENTFETANIGQFCISFFYFFWKYCIPVSFRFSSEYRRYLHEYHP